MRYVSTFALVKIQKHILILKGNSQFYKATTNLDSFRWLFWFIPSKVTKISTMQGFTLSTTFKEFQRLKAANNKPKPAYKVINYTSSHGI